MALEDSLNKINKEAEEKIERAEKEISDTYKSAHDKTEAEVEAARKNNKGDSKKWVWI